MNKLKWFYDKDEAEVVTENNVNVIYTDELDCPDFVIEMVIKLYNVAKADDQLVGSGGIIDTYLCDEPLCSEEDREIICESIAEFIEYLSSPIKLLLTEKALHIPNGELERIRDMFQLKGEETLWGYDNTFTDDDTVSSGYLHYEGNFYLSKESFDKPRVTIADIAVIE